MWKDFLQASFQCLPYGWMPSGCWFGMQEVYPRLPVCKRTDGSIPWGWQPWRMWDTPGWRCLQQAGLPSKSPVVSSCVEPLPPQHIALSNTSASRCYKWTPYRRRHIFLSFSFDSFLCGSTINFMQPPRSELSSIIDNPCQLIPRCCVFQMRSLPCSFPSRSSVNCCTLLSTFVNPVHEMAK